jgi:hypothetical protein
MTKTIQIKNWNEIVCMTWVISLPSCHAKSFDHNWLIWVVVLLLMLSLTPFLFILSVCVLGGGLFLQLLPVAAVSTFIVALIGNRKKGKNKMTASKTASCSLFLF